MSSLIYTLLRNREKASYKEEQTDEYAMFRVKNMFLTVNRCF